MAAECLLHLESLGGQKMDGLRSGKLQDTHKGWVAGWLGLCCLSWKLSSPQVTFLDGSPVGTECPLQDNHVRGRLDALGTGRGVPQVLVT